MFHLCSRQDFVTKHGNLINSSALHVYLSVLHGPIHRYSFGKINTYAVEIS